MFLFSSSSSSTSTSLHDIYILKVLITWIALLLLLLLLVLLAICILVCLCFSARRTSMLLCIFMQREENYVPAVDFHRIIVELFDCAALPLRCATLIYVSIVWFFVFPSSNVSLFVVASVYFFFFLLLLLLLLTVRFT